MEKSLSGLYIYSTNQVSKRRCSRVPGSDFPFAVRFLEQREKVMVERARFDVSRIYRFPVIRAAACRVLRAAAKIRPFPKHLKMIYLKNDLLLQLSFNRNSQRVKNRLTFGRAFCRRIRALCGRRKNGCDDNYRTNYKF